MTGTDYRLPGRPIAPGDPVEPERFEVIEDTPVKSLITRPQDGAAIEQGEPLVVEGWAWSGRTPVDRVEVSCDDGTTWDRATLDRDVDRWAWRRFRFERAPLSGARATILARATDAVGRAQPVPQAWNPRGYCNNGCHRIEVTVASARS